MAFKKAYWVILFVLLGAFSFWFTFPWETPKAEQDENELVTKTVKNVSFSVPQDWEIRDGGGTVAPIPVEEYLSIKFTKVDTRFKNIETQTAETKSGLEQLTNTQLKDVEDKISDLDARLQDMERWLKQGEARRM
jgi:hypothetical protein